MENNNALIFYVKLSYKLRYQPQLIVSIEFFIAAFVLLLVIHFVSGGFFMIVLLFLLSVSLIGAFLNLIFGIRDYFSYIFTIKSKINIYEKLVEKLGSEKMVIFDAPYESENGTRWMSVLRSGSGEFTLWWFTSDWGENLREPKLHFQHIREDIVIRSEIYYL